MKPASLVAAISTLPVILGYALLGTTEARAVPYVVTIDQEGPNVVATSNAGGEFNTSGLFNQGPLGVSFIGSITPLEPNGPTLNMALSPSAETWESPFVFGDFVGPSALGPGPPVCMAPTCQGFPFPGVPPQFGTPLASSSNGGPSVGFGAGSENPNRLVLPGNYMNGDPLAITQITFDNMTLASLGVALGTYHWTWGNLPDQSFTIDVVEAPEIPLPAALPLFASGLGALGLLGWRRKRKAQAVA